MLSAVVVLALLYLVTRKPEPEQTEIADWLKRTSDEWKDGDDHR